MMMYSARNGMVLYLNTMTVWLTAIRADIGGKVL